MFYSQNQINYLQGFYRVLVYVRVLWGRRSLDLGRGPRSSVAVTQATAMAAQTGEACGPSCTALTGFSRLTRHSPALIGFHMQLPNDTHDIWKHLGPVHEGGVH